jgi:hypothetical protein
MQQTTEPIEKVNVGKANTNREVARNSQAKCPIASLKRKTVQMSLPSTVFHKYLLQKKDPPQAEDTLSSFFS